MSYIERAEEPHKVQPGSINTKLIAQNWDDFLRVAGSLKMGTISGSELIRSLQRGSKKSMLARAIGELGPHPEDAPPAGLYR